MLRRRIRAKINLTGFHATGNMASVQPFRKPARTYTARNFCQMQCNVNFCHMPANLSLTLYILYLHITGPQKYLHFIALLHKRPTRSALSNYK